MDLQINDRIKFISGYYINNIGYFSGETQKYFLIIFNNKCICIDKSSAINIISKI